MVDRIMHMKNQSGPCDKTAIYGRYNPEQEEIAGLLKHIGTFGGYLDSRVRALDFACGVGESTRALSPFFNHCYGVEFTESLIKEAKELNGDYKNCTYLPNTEKRFKLFPDDYFDFIHVNSSLQYFPEKKVVKTYLSEFVRTLRAKGVLVFELPSYIPLKQRLQPNKTLQVMLRMLGFNERYSIEKMKLHPVRSICIPENEITLFTDLLGAKILDVKRSIAHATGMQIRTYFVSKTKMWY